MSENMTDLGTLTLVLSWMADTITNLTNFTEKQTAVNSKLEFLLELTERVKCLESKTVMIKSCLSNEVKMLKSNYRQVKLG